MPESGLEHSSGCPKTGGRPRLHRPKRTTQPVPNRTTQPSADKGKLAARRGRKARGLKRDSSAASGTSRRTSSCSRRLAPRHPELRGSWAAPSPVATLICLASLCLPAVSAVAAVAPAECAGQVFSQPFTAFGDSNYYTLVRGGEFNSASEGWELSKGARIITTTRPYGSGAGGVLDLPSGAVAISPPVCVTLQYPTARVWVRNVKGAEGVAVGLAYAGTSPNRGQPPERRTGAWPADRMDAVEPDQRPAADRGLPGRNTRSEVCVHRWRYHQRVPALRAVGQPPHEVTPIQLVGTRSSTTSGPSSASKSSPYSKTRTATAAGHLFSRPVNATSASEQIRISPLILEAAA